METFNNHLCYVILFENHQHGGTHGMTNRLRGYTRQKRLGNTDVDNNITKWQKWVDSMEIRGTKGQGKNSES